MKKYNKIKICMYMWLYNICNIIKRISYEKEEKNVVINHDHDRIFIFSLNTYI